MTKVLIIVFAVICFNSVSAYLEFEVFRKAFDTTLYDNALDEELCKAQLSYILNNNTMLSAEFLDAGIRIPRGILKGNFVDLGNYHQCIEISANFEPSNIKGKYCMINIPMVQDNLELPAFPERSEEWPEWPEFPWPELLPNTKQHSKMVRSLQQVRAETAKYSIVLAGLGTEFARSSEAIDLADHTFRLAVCLPKACTTKQFLDTLLINTTAVGLDVTEEFCRLKNDKPFVPGVSSASFSYLLSCAQVTIYIILKLSEETTGIIIYVERFACLENYRRRMIRLKYLMSIKFGPSYYAWNETLGSWLADIRSFMKAFSKRLIDSLEDPRACAYLCQSISQTIQRDSKKVSKLGKSFSLYTNTRRLLTFNSASGALECLDGIRAFAIMWVIIGHTYSTNLNSHFFNRIDVFTWMTSLSAIWIVAAPITVDTFFLLSGLLIVYTAAGKMSRISLLKNLHLFYLQRLLRMFPILATGVFLQATLFNHLSDGPEWYIVGDKVERCRTYWWSTLSYLQNYLTNTWCVGPTWYLAVDVQMHIFSPIVLFWVLGKRQTAWIALSTAMLTIMVVSTTYNYLNKFPPSSFVQTRTAEDLFHYTKQYYINTLTRCSPFFVGMLFGYLLHVFKGKEVHIPKWLVGLCWLCATAISSSIIYAAYPITQMDWDSPFWDGIINSFSRPGWAACLGWLIFACTHGYGGPVNWFLSLRLWKLPARISFAMYIFHYPIMHIINATSVSPTHFTVLRYFYRFLGDFSSTFLISFIVTVMIDSPFSTLIKLAMGGGPKRLRTEKIEAKEENGAQNLGYN